MKLGSFEHKAWLRKHEGWPTTQQPRPDTNGWNGMPEGQPRFCFGCNEKVTLGKEPVWFRTNEPLRTWHMRCYYVA